MISAHRRDTLDTLEWQADETAPERIVVAMHGYGSNADDLIGLGESLGSVWRERGGPRCRWVAPNAPLQPAELRSWNGRAWWELRLSELIDRLQTAAGLQELVAAVPPGMDEARSQVCRAIDAVHAETGLDWERTYLAGFSQGAMLASDTTIRGGSTPRGLVTLSGALLAKSAWEDELSSDGRCPVFGSHGRHDPTLPFAAGQMLSQFFGENGFATQFEAFDGGHTVPQPVLIKLLAWFEGVESEEDGP